MQFVAVALGYTKVYGSIFAAQKALSASDDFASLTAPQRVMCTCKMLSVAAFNVAFQSRIFARDLFCCSFSRRHNARPRSSRWKAAAAKKKGWRFSIAVIAAQTFVILSDTDAILLVST
jgi:hypothetical protein